MPASPPAKSTVLTAALGALLATSCGFELPSPPDLEPLNAEYDEPSANLGPQFAATLLQDYVRELERLARIGSMRDVRQLATDFDESVTVTNEDSRQRVAIDGVPINADAIVQFFAACEASEDGTEDDITAQLIVRDSQIVPVLWGHLNGCMVAPDDDVSATRLSITGKVSVYLPNVATDGEPLYLIRYTLTQLVGNAEELQPWNGSIRLVGEVLELLITNSDGESAVVFGGPNPAIVGVRAANGRWQCNLEEQRCTSTDSGASFSY